VELYETTRRHAPDGSDLHSYDLEDLTLVNFVCDFRLFGVGLPVKCLITFNIKRDCSVCVPSTKF
jgi:hypothetical protein